MHDSGAVQKREQKLLGVPEVKDRTGASESDAVIKWLDSWGTSPDHNGV